MFSDGYVPKFLQLEVVIDGGPEDENRRFPCKKFGLQVPSDEDFQTRESRLFFNIVTKLMSKGCR